MMHSNWRPQPNAYRWDLEKLRRRLRRRSGWVRLELNAPQARSVQIAGDFNDWVPDASTTLQRNMDGTWQGTFRLPEGQYEYKFLMDGTWVNDPANPKKVANVFGTTNDVLAVAGDPREPRYDN